MGFVILVPFGDEHRNLNTLCLMFVMVVHPVKLVPDYNICKELAKDFDDQDMLKIGLDLQDDL